MSRKMLAVAAFALMAPIAMSQAQIKFGVAAGATIPSGDLSSGNQTGYHIMATAGVHPPLSPVGFRVDGMFNQLNFKSGLGVDGEHANIMGLTANAVLGMPGAVVISPYLIGGVGYYRLTSSLPGDVASNKMGVNIGAGVKFGLAGFDAFGEARFHQVFQDKDPATNTTPKFRFIPISFGIMF